MRHYLFALPVSCVLFAASTPSPTFVEGRVLGPDGRPVVGALVCLTGGEGAGLGRQLPLKRVRSDNSGHFRIPVSPRQTGIVSAWAQDLAPTTMSLPIEPRALELRLVQANSGVKGQIKTPQAGLAGGWAMVSPDNLALMIDLDGIGKTWPGGVVPIREGRVEVPLPPGSYTVALSVPGCGENLTPLKVEGWTSFETKLVPSAKPAPQHVVRWLRKSVQPLSGTSPELPFKDLEPLRALVGNARLVGLGEASHGTREFFQMKHRILAFLVKEMGFTHFGIEASLPDCLALNDYVTKGVGDPAKLIGAMGFWTWDTEEVLEMVRWMRHHNAHSLPESWVRFVGFDMQSRDQLVPMLMERLKPVLPEIEGRLAKEIAPLAEGWGYDPPATVSEVRSKLAVANQALSSIQALGLRNEEWRLTELLARVLVQNLKMIEAEASGSFSQSFQARDIAMAENVSWLLGEAGASSRMVLWAHNGHIDASEEGLMGIYPTFGRSLRRAFGDSYRPIGFTFLDGGFQAKGPRNEGLRAFAVGHPPASSLASALAQTAKGPALLDLRAIPATGGVQAWFRAKRPDWNISALFDGCWPDASLIEGSSSVSFDGLVYIPHTTRARPLAGSVGIADLPIERIHAKPMNLHLETLEGWSQISSGASLRAEAGGGVVHAGDDSMAPGKTILFQAVDAAPYRGRTLVVDIAPSANQTSRCTPWLRVDGEKGLLEIRKGAGPSATTTQSGAKLTIPQDARTLLFGVAFTGVGTRTLKAIELVAR